MTIPDAYFESIQQLSSSSLDLRMRTIKILLGREKERTIDLYNRYLYDSVKLLKGDWKKEEPQWLFTDINALNDEGISEKVPGDLRAELKKAISMSKKRTAATYEELIASVKKKPFVDPGKYLAWFNRNLPYLVLDFTKKNMDSVKKAKQRLDVFIKYSPDNTLTESLCSLGERYIVNWLAPGTSG